MKMQRSNLNQILQKAQILFETTQNIRRDLHRFPELGFQEYRTAGVISKELLEMGLEVTSGIAETGVVASIPGARPGKTVMLRFDMDALPVTEETGASYASQNAGVMHACGHDGHVAIGLTAARILNDLRDELAGTIKLIFQPAEEGLGGAERMIAGGVLEQPRPDIALGLHLWNEKPIGWFGLTPGPIMAAAEVFEIELTGKGGHGALPHLAVDPVTAASQIVLGLQTIVSRNVSPLQSAVVSVTMIRGGETFNVIPARVYLKGTIRTFDLDIRSLVLRRFDEIVQGIANAAGCNVRVDLKSLTPAVMNSPQITQRVIQVAEQLFPTGEIVTDFRTMGSEDMAFFLNEVPGCFFFVGSANYDEHLDAPHHHPRFDFDEKALPLGAALISAATVSFLSQG